MTAFEKRVYFVVGTLQLAKGNPASSLYWFLVSLKMGYGPAFGMLGLIVEFNSCEHLNANLNYRLAARIYKKGKKVVRP